MPGTTNENVLIYPNPSPGTFQIKYPINTFEHIQVFDISGQLLRRESLSGTQKTITANLQSGVYLIRLSGKSKSTVRKLIISK